MWLQYDETPDYVVSEKFSVSHRAGIHGTGFNK